MATKKIIYLIVLITVFSGITNQLFAQRDSIKFSTSLSTKKILNLKTSWAESSNPASLAFFDFEKKIGTAYIYNIRANGYYQLFQQGNSVNKAGFFTDGYVKLDKWKFYGKFNYFSESDKNVKWVDVMEPYNDNPYTLGDSIGGNYTKEYFNMEGKGSYRLSEFFSFGFDVKYLAGVGAKRKDPRPKNTITHFDILPGIIFNLNKIKIGANFRYEGSKEDIEITTVTGNRFDLFHFKGLGFFTSTTENDNRSNESDLLGGGLQFNFAGQQLNNLTEVNFYKKSTDIKRGTTYPLQIVLLEKFNTDIVSTFLFSPSGKNIKKLKLFFTDKRIYGSEPVVEPKLEQVTYQWSTVAKYTLYWSETREYGVNYSYYYLADANHINWGAAISGKINSDRTTYYFVPEYNRQTLNLFCLDVLLEKGWMFNTWETLLSVDGRYRNSFDSSLEIVKDEKLLSTVNATFVTHDFDYYNSGLWQVGVSTKIGKTISVYQSPVQVFLDAGYKLIVSGLPGNPQWKTFDVKLGMNF